MIDIINKNLQSKKVDEHVLDSLIASNKLISFCRSGKWVAIGKDAVRENNTFHSGEERRRMTYGANFCMK